MKATMVCILVCCMIIIYDVNEAYGQEKVNLDLGIDFPELLNCGIFLQNKQLQYGITIGAFYFDWGDFIGDILSYSIAGSLQYHFSGISEFSERRLWYIKSGICYFAASPLDKYYLLSLRIGRDFNSNEKRGVNFSLGLSLGLSDRGTAIENPFSGEILAPKYKFAIFPSAGLCWFFRISKKNRV